MGEQLKEQTLFNVSTEKNDKNIYHVDIYVTGTEGSTGTYSTRRITEAMLKDVFSPKTHVETFIPVGSYTANLITHNLGTTDFIIQIWDEKTNELIECEVRERTLTTVELWFTENPTEDVRVMMIAII
jgi:hypothetical protein